MRTVKGEVEYKRWTRGLGITLQQAIEAHCFTCNNREDTPCDAEASCALYAFSPFRRSGERLQEKS